MNLQKGLVGHWTLSTLKDSSAYDNHGTANGATETTGFWDGAYYFEADNNDYINLGVVGDEFAIGTGDYTFSVWANFESITNSSTIFELSRYTDALLIRPDDNGPQLQIYMDNNATDRYFGPNIEGTTGKWYHFVVRRTGDTVEVFENNTSIGTKSGMDGTFEINQESYIGMSVHNTGQNHDGKLQDMRFYDRALSESEINALYNMRSPRHHKPLVTQTNVNGKTVTLERDSFGAWICVQNYEHYGGTNPTPSPGSTFPQLPNGKRTIGDIQSAGTNGELRHVDNITQYGDWQVDAVRLEGETSGHNRKMNYYTEDSTVISSIVDNSTSVGHTYLDNQITKYPDHSTALPDEVGSTNTTDSNSNRIFGNGFPMFGSNPYSNNNAHWAVQGQSNRWEMDDYPNDSSNTTIHRVWVRTGLFE